MIIFGGAGLDADERSVNLNDLHVFCSERMEWSQPRRDGAFPQARVWLLESLSLPPTSYV